MKTFPVKKVHITEKATDLNKIGKYVFMVELSATKNEIKKAIKEIYGVEAARVDTLRLPAKKSRFRNLVSKKGDYKKAVVTLRAGQKIDIQ